LLECDHVSDDLRHIAGDYRDMFALLFDRHAPKVELEYFDAQRGELPGSVDACDGYLTTGSRYSAYDDPTWIEELKNFVRRLEDADKPFVGICFGHQVLAEALGGRVRRAERGWGIGAHQMKIVQSETWMKPPQNDCALLYSHCDQVERLPEGSVVLATSEHCPVAMFRTGERMLGIQGHPEFTAEYAEALVRGRTELIGTEHVRKADFKTKADEAVITSWMVNFLAR
jgi:GMP synthase-like glutamine amidotransferase